MVLLYDRTSIEEGVNRARKELFSKKGRVVFGLPTTLAVLIEHTKRDEGGKKYFGEDQIIYTDIMY